MDSYLLTAFNKAAIKPLFILTLIYKNDKTGKFEKYPAHYSSVEICNAFDEKNRGILEDVLFNYRFQNDKKIGIGFVLTKEDDYFCIDLDNCYDESDNLSDVAKLLLEKFPDAYRERSTSGKGLHIIARGKANLHKCRNSELNIELYTENRFIALTQNEAKGCAEVDYTTQLNEIITQYFNLKDNQNAHGSSWTDYPHPAWRGPLEDKILIERMLKSKPASKIFKDGPVVTFSDLWNANAEVLGALYTDPLRDYDASRADAALAQYLAFWTGNNCERMKKLMFESKLVREKWNREGYITRTILDACNKCKSYLNSPQLDAKPAEFVSEAITTRQGATFLNADHQLELFKGCIYVRDENRILTPTGELLDMQRFNVEYGGYSFTLDPLNQNFTRKAWDAFTQSQLIVAPRVSSTCFRPLEAPGSVLEIEGKRLVNIYYPVPVIKIKGDVTIFTNHLEKLIPDEEDNEKLISYLAFCVQYPGIKAGWCPVIQGVQGNGKTLILTTVGYAVGMKYVHFARPHQLTHRFNDCLYGKMLIGVDDIMLDSQLNSYEILKPMISDGYLEIESKGKDKVTRNICANFIMTTNHKNGILFFKNERRFAYFFSNQQSVEDLHRDGMDARYFQKIFRWLNDNHGFAMVAEYLSQYPIKEELNPAELCLRAPRTNVYDEVIGASYNDAQLEILEAIEQGKPGFRNGWISSIMVDRLLESLKLTNVAPRRGRKNLIEGIGYCPHPHLREGRVNNVVTPDNSKPRLFITPDHPDRHLAKAREIEYAYSQSQS